MTTKPGFFALTVAALVAAGVSSAALAQDDGASAGQRAGAAAERTRPKYLREPVERPATPEAPDSGEIPEALQVVKITTPAVVEPMRRGEAYDVDDGDLAGEAARAADWAAEEMARTRGWPQYYRVGFHRGLHVALDDDTLGSWDYVEGVRFGRRDPEARDMGIDAGRSAAEEAAAGPAAAQVAEQFRNLSREPRFEPRPIAPAWSADGTWAASPVRSDVFVAYPIARTVRLDRRAAEALSGWDWDAGRLYECHSYGEFYDARWNDVELAFLTWKEGERRSALYRKHLTREDRELFHAIFVTEYRRRMSTYYEPYLAAGYREGFHDGWSYGAFANREWHYRRGYTTGFDEAVTLAAASGFEAAYPYAFEGHYRDAFAEWSENPMPGVVSVRLSDAGADGIFEPGEEVLVDYELANYGGRDGDFTVEIAGREIDRPREITTHLAARSALRASEPARVRIDPLTPVRTQSDIDVRVAGEHRSAELLVSHPLEFTREVDLDRDTLNGRAVIRVLAVNRSRKPVAATVDLERVEGYGFMTTSRDLGVLSPGARDWAVFDIDGLRPLDAVSGRVRAHFSARSGDRVQDALTFEFPDAVSDLRNRDLLELIVAFARDPSVPQADVAEARALLLRRLEVDWNVAARGDGNPYEDDFKTGGTETALGDLVQTYLRNRSGIRSSTVFAGLDDEIEALAEDLPGTHPFLRKSMKRLAKKLG
jgi:hypothetical protein